MRGCCAVYWVRALLKSDLPGISRKHLSSNKNHSHLFASSDCMYSIVCYIFTLFTGKDFFFKKRTMSPLSDPDSSLVFCIY